MPELSNDTIKEQRDSAFRFRGQQATYRQITATTNPKIGTVTATNIDTVIGDGASDDPGVMTSQVDDKTIRASAGRYQVGDRTFRIRHDDMPETPPKTTNQILFNGETFKIIEHRRSSDGNVWDIIARKA